MKKRILFVQNRLSFGGTSSLIMFIVRILSNEYVFDMFCYEDGANELEEEFIKYGGSILKDKRLFCSSGFFGKLKQYRLKIFGGFKRVFNKNIKNKEYYGVHCFEEFVSAYYLKVASRLGTEKRIVHFCNDQKQKRKLNFVAKHLRKKEACIINKYATNIVADSSNSSSDLLDSTKIRLILDPIDKRFIFSEATPTNLSLTQVGMICDNKNQLFTLSIFDILIRKYGLADAKLTIVGPCSDANLSYKEEVERKISELGLKENVFIKPATLDLPSIFNKTSYLVFPSKKESFGMVLIEAQACGLQCFSSYAAAKETNLGGVTYLSLNDGPEKWAESIYNSYLSNKGKKVVFDVSGHSPEAIRKEFIKLYE